MAATERARRILIAEDSPTQAEQLRHMLEQNGCEVVVAENGVTALELLSGRPVDLVISDIVMPQMDGYELCRRIRADAALAALPVMLLTALTDTRDVLEGLSCGADSFITKPYSEDYLLVQITRMLSDQRQAGGGDATVNVDVFWAGKTCTIVTDQKRTINLLISTYEAAVRRNTELSRAQEDLRGLNDRLEDLVEERTAALSAEIAVRTQMEKELRGASLYTRSLIEASLDALVVIGLDGRINDVNSAAEQVTGVSRDRLIGSDLAGYVTDPEKARAGFEQALAGGTVSNVPLAIRHCSGSTTEVLFNAGVFRNESGEVQGVFAAARDVTEKQRLEDLLRQAQKMEAIGRLAGGVAHDFNNLTAIVLGYGEMLLGELPPGNPLRKYAEQIMAAGQRSAALTRQLLAFSRKQTLQPEVLDLNALLRNLELMLSRLIPGDIELIFNLGEDLGRVVADPGQIEQVVTNLALNARDAMPLGGRLTIETADVEIDALYAMRHESVVPGSYVMFSLTDTGCGMDKQTMARLFEPFFTTKPKGKGTGLGLATVFGIVKQTGGHIWAYSEPGEGTTFKIYLPRTEAPLAAKDAENGGASPRGDGERILLVEDEEALRELCETVLTRLGYRVSSAANGLEALNLAWQQGLEPDLVLTDVIMPGMSGAEMTERLRRRQAGLKVLYMSGHPDETIVPHGVLQPGLPFIQKPFTERALAVKVREVLQAEPAAVRMCRRVLMIDDDDQFRDLTRYFCTKRGHRFTGVSDAAAALEALAAHSFDVLLVDLNFPGTDGEHLLREIRAAGHATPAVVLTGDAASADRDRLRPLGVACVVEKSSNSEGLLRAIEEVAASGDGRGGAAPG